MVKYVHYITTNTWHLDETTLYTFDPLTTFP